MQQALDALVSLFDLEDLEVNLFRGHSPQRMQALAPEMPEKMRAWALRDRPIDMRYVTDFDPIHPEKQPRWRRKV